MEKSDYLIKNQQIILVNFQIIYISHYFAYHILYYIRLFGSEIGSLYPSDSYKSDMKFKK
jgi:hypothetical protein